MFILPQKLNLENFVNIILNQEKIGLSLNAKKKITASAKLVEKIAEQGKIVYGINTGFGGLSDKLISKENASALQKNLILSHACGVDDPLPSEISRGLFLLLINSLAKGYSGIRLETLKTLIKIFNQGIVPLIPRKGSVGASGDLAPLAHLALLLLGQGKAIYKNKTINGEQVLKLINEKPLALSFKEGLALVNGTHAMASLLAFGVFKAINLSDGADIIAAATFEALDANPVFLNEKIHKLKPYEGQINTARDLRKILNGSEIFNKNHKRTNGQTQDAYSLRCTPQVHGTSKDAIKYAKNIIETELNSVTDNPLIIDGKFLSGGNFHGQSLAMAADFLSIAVSELSDISERRIDRLINPLVSGGLPPFLAKDSGLNCGFMVAQYTAVALVSHNKILCHPAVVDSIPTSAQQEDHVSMGMTACLKLQEIISNSEKVLAIELMAACQAIELKNKQKKCGKGVKIAYDILRKNVAFLKKDRPLSEDIEKTANLISNGEISQ